MEEKNSNKHNKLSLLDVFATNLHPDLAQQVKESWIDPSAISIEQLIGHGKLKELLSANIQVAAHNHMRLKLSKLFL